MNTRTQNETIADRLKSARLHLNLKSKDFANAAGINPHNYSSVESGARTVVVSQSGGMDVLSAETKQSMMY